MDVKPEDNEENDEESDEDDEDDDDEKMAIDEDDENATLKKKTKKKKKHPKLKPCESQLNVAAVTEEQAVLAGLEVQALQLIEVAQEIFRRRTGFYSSD